MSDFFDKTAIKNYPEEERIRLERKREEQILYALENPGDHAELLRMRHELGYQGKCMTKNEVCAEVFFRKGFIVAEKRGPRSGAPIDVDSYWLITLD